LERLAAHGGAIDGEMDAIRNVIDRLDP